MKIVVVAFGTAIALFALTGLLGPTYSSTGERCPGTAIGDLLWGVRTLLPAAAADCRSAAGVQVATAGFVLAIGVALMLVPVFQRIFHNFEARQLQREVASGVWYIGPVGRFWGWIFTVGPPLMCLIGLAIARNVGWLLATVFLLGYSVFVYRLSLHPRLELAGGDILVVNSMRSVRVAAIDAVRIGLPGYWGIPIGMRDGSTITANAGQKSNLAVARGARTHGDLVADALTTYVTGVSGVAKEQLTVPSEARLQAKRSARSVLIFGLGALAVVLLIRTLLLR